MPDESEFADEAPSAKVLYVVLNQSLNNRTNVKKVWDDISKFHMQCVMVS